jgi:hypothetical protein
LVISSRSSSDETLLPRILRRSMYFMALTTRTVGALGQMGHQAGGDYWLRW